MIRKVRSLRERRQRQDQQRWLDAHIASLPTRRRRRAWLILKPLLN